MTTPISRLERLKAALFPEPVNGVSDDAYYNLMGVEYAIKDHDVGAVDLRTVQRVMGQLAEAKKILDEAAPSETAERICPDCGVRIEPHRCHKGTEF